MSESNIKKLLKENSSDLQLTPIRLVNAAVAECRKKMDVVGSIMGEPDHATFPEGLLASIIGKAKLLDYNGLVGALTSKGNSAEEAAKRADAFFDALGLDKNQQAGPGGYGMTAGDKDLLEVLAKAETSRLDYPVKPEQVMVTAGGNHAMMCTLSGLLGETPRTLIVHEPCFPVYRDFAKVLGMPMEAIDTTNTGFVVDPQVLKDKIQQTNGGHCVVVINYPNNPSSKHASEQTLKAYAKVVEECPNAIFIDDAIYAGLTYQGTTNTLANYVSGDARDRTILIRAATKEHAHADARIGHIVAHPAVIQKMLPHAVYNGVHANRDAQKQYLADTQVFAERQPAIAEHYRKRVGILSERLKKVGLIEESQSPDGGFFLTLNLSSLKGKPLDNNAKEFLRNIAAGIPYVDLNETSVSNDYQACAMMMSTIGVPSVPLSAFYINNAGGHAQDLRVRLTVTGKLEQLQEIANRLELLSHWANGQATAQDQLKLQEIQKSPERQVG